MKKDHPAITFPDRVRDIIARIKSEGYDAYAVGGCIRDSFLGRVPHDWDLTTSARPEEVMRIFSEGDIHVIGTAGIRHGTVMVKAGTDVFEITTFRCDGEYSDHRRPSSVVFSGAVEDDLARRDFTVNAIAAKPMPDGAVIKDPFGGASDIAAGVIRTVGDAEARFNEDALRILRAVRFSAELGFNVDPATADAAISLRGTLAYVSAERITSELWRILCAPYAHAAVRRFREIFEWIADGQVPDRFYKYVGEVSDPRVRLALMLEHGSDGEYLFDKLRFSNAVRTFVLSLLSLERPPHSRAEVCTLMRRFGDELPAVSEYLRVLRCDGMFPDGYVGDELMSEADAVISSGLPYTLSMLAVKGGDVIACGVASRSVGEVLEYLLAEVREGRVPNEKSALTAAIPDRYKI